MNWQLMLITYAALTGLTSLFSFGIVAIIFDDTGNKKPMLISLFFLSTAILAAVLAAGLS